MQQQNPSSTSDKPYCPMREACPTCNELDYKLCGKYIEKTIYETPGACGGISCEDYYEPTEPHRFEDEDNHRMLEDMIRGFDE